MGKIWVMFKHPANHGGFQLNDFVLRGPTTSTPPLELLGKFCSGKLTASSSI